jgi:hypothetical protein
MVEPRDRLLAELDDERFFLLDVACEHRRLLIPHGCLALFSF